MILGIKVGPQRQSLIDLEKTNAPFAEVWFNINRLDDYTDLFTHLAHRNVDVGIHFWGLTKSGALVNIAYADKDDINDSMILIRQTIDIAARNKFQYVNIHPGSQARISYDFNTEEFQLLSAPIDVSDATNIFITNAKKLNAYASQRGVVFTIESVPLRVTHGYREFGPRIQPLNIYELPITAIQKAAQDGLTIANDFGHTASSIISKSHIDVWKHVKFYTTLLADCTRLIHLGFIIPPYNGTDNHDMLNNPILNTNDAIPNKIQIIELLKTFKHRNDVWVITEPKEDHVRNYFWAKEIVEQSLDLQ